MTSPPNKDAAGWPTIGGPAGAAPGRIEVFGDAALLLVLDDRIDPLVARRAQAIAAVIDAARSTASAMGRPIAAHASVFVPFDPLAIAIDDVAAIVEAAARTAPTDAEPVGRPPVEIAVRYGGEDGPDLDAIAALHDLDPDEVIELHAGATYDVRFFGFAPGFAYLGGLPGRLVTPRRAAPRPRVPAGSVGIAGEQTAVYPLAMPGGWHLIGRTEARLWDETSPSPTLLRPGDRVRFVPVR